MFWQIIIYLTALQAHHVFCSDDQKSKSSCECAYSQLENLCYDFTGAASDYFSVQDIHPRDGFFAVREASLYVAYNACGKITRSLCNYRSGVELEQGKVGGGSAAPGGGSNVPNSPSTTTTPSSSPSSTTPSTNDPLSSNLTTVTPPPSTSSPPPATSSPTPSPSGGTPPPNGTPPPSGGTPPP